MRIRIGSFNLHKMGGFETKKDHEKIADIIRGERLDIVSLQEIFAAGKGLDFCLKYLPNGWKYVFDKPKDSKEGYAFLWDGRKFEYSTFSTTTGPREFLPRIVNSKGSDVKADCYKMERPPFYARFVPKRGDFIEIRLINVHLFHGGNDSSDSVKKRQIEYDVLVNQILPGIDVDRSLGNNRVAYTIAMGDYNLKLKKSVGLIKTFIDESKPFIMQDEVRIDGQRIRTVQHELTTLKSKQDDDTENRYANNYDHFTFNVSALERRGNRYKYKRIDAVKDYCEEDYEMYQSKISDHVPIVFELNTGEVIAYDNNGYRKTS